jgi:nicotinate dehydrogenase subunit B
MSAVLTRRSVLAGGGGLVMAFSLSGARAENKDSPSTRPALPGSLEDTPKLVAWIRIDRSGAVTILTGKAELGQGVNTAFLQIAAEELRVPFAGLTLITADTSLTADEGFTAASHSLQDSGTAIRNAAAQVREILIGEAARRLNVDRAELRTASGTVIGPINVHIHYASWCVTSFSPSTHNQRRG